MFNFGIIKKRKIWMAISGVLVLTSVIALFSWGLKFGIDFTGGSLLEVKFHEKVPEVTETREALSDLELNSLIIQPTENNSLILRFSDESPNIHGDIMERLKELANYSIENSEGQDSVVGESLSLEVNGSDNLSEESSGELIDVEVLDDSFALGETTPALEELRFDSVGSSIGQELKTKSFNAAIIVLILIILYISLIFRKVSRPVSSWKYGIATIVALFHDIIIVLGVFAFLGHFYNVEINTPFIAAILTVLGYSVNDSIIVFDRIRENLPKSNLNFPDTVNKSINQTLIRSINTSVTTLLVLLAIIFFGGESIREFVLALAIGIIVGTYSSIFVASPILTLFDKSSRR
jgi:preprotein translocase subunit SecF